MEVVAVGADAEAGGIEGKRVGEGFVWLEVNGVSRISGVETGEERRAENQDAFVGAAVRARPEDEVAEGVQAESEVVESAGPGRFAASEGDGFEVKPGLLLR